MLVLASTLAGCAPSSTAARDAAVAYVEAIADGRFAKAAAMEAGPTTGFHDDAAREEFGDVTWSIAEPIEADDAGGYDLWDAILHGAVQADYTDTGTGEQVSEVIEIWCAPGPISLPSPDELYIEQPGACSTERP